MTIQHPLPAGTMILSYTGERDCNGFSGENALGVIVGYQGEYKLQGHTYDVLFPLVEKDEDAEEDDATTVWVVIDQGDSIDDEAQYKIIPKPDAAAALAKLLDDVLGGTDFGCPVESEDHPFHESVKDARTALVYADLMAKLGK